MLPGYIIHIVKVNYRKSSSCTRIWGSHVWLTPGTSVVFLWKTKRVVWGAGKTRQLCLMSAEREREGSESQMSSKASRDEMGSRTQALCH